MHISDRHFLRLCILPLAALFLDWTSAAYAASDAMSAYVKRDYVTALREFHRQANLGDAVAKYNLGIMYEQGQGTAQDPAEAVKWYQMAAEDGVANAKLNLGLMYEQGRGTTRDYAQAAMWYEAAANQNVIHAQINLALLHGQGRGVPQDYVQAYMWSSVAASKASNSPDRARAAQIRDIVAREMTPDQLAEAKKLTRDWKPKRK